MLYNIDNIHNISLQYEWFDNDNNYRGVQRLHYTKHIHEASLQHICLHENEDYRIVQSSLNEHTMFFSFISNAEKEIIKKETCIKEPFN